MTVYDEIFDICHGFFVVAGCVGVVAVVIFGLRSLLFVLWKNPFISEEEKHE